MKKLIVIVLLLAAVSACAQTRNFGALQSDNLWSGKQTFQKPVFSGYTVATLPVSPSAYQVAIVTDGLTAGDCVAGGGSFVVLCSYYSGAWNAIGGGGSGNATQFMGVDLLPGSPLDGQLWTFNQSSGKYELTSPGALGVDWNNPGTIGGTTPNTGVFSALNGVRFADQFAGAEIGAKINAAVADLGSAPGVIEVAGTIAGNVTGTAVATLGKGHTLRVRGKGVLTIGGIRLTDSTTDLTGTGAIECPEGATIKLANGSNRDLISQTNFGTLTGTASSYGLWHTVIAGCKFDANKANNTAGYGIRIFGRANALDTVLVQNAKNDGIWVEGNGAGSLVDPSGDGENALYHIRSMWNDGNGLTLKMNDANVGDVVTWGNGGWGFESWRSVHISNLNSYLNGSGGCRVAADGLNGSHVDCTNAAGYGLLIDSGTGIVDLSASTFACNGCTAIGVKSGSAHQLTGTIANSTVGIEFNGGGVGRYDFTGFANTTLVKCTSFNGNPDVSYNSLEAGLTLFEVATCGTAPSVGRWRIRTGVATLDRDEAAPTSFVRNGLTLQWPTSGGTLAVAGAATPKDGTIRLTNQAGVAGTILYANPSDNVIFGDDGNHFSNLTYFYQQGGVVWYVANKAFHQLGGALYLDGTNPLLWGTDGGADIGAVAANRPNRVYAKTEVVTPKLSGITDTTLVINLNADMLDGKHFSDFGVLSFNSRTGAIVPTAGDYSFAKISNNIAWSQFPTGCTTNQIPKYNGSSWACDNDQVGSAGAGITTINGLTTDPQSFAFDTSDANLRLTVSSVSSTHTFYPTWNGTLSKPRGGTGADNSSVTFPSSGTIAISTDITKTAVGLANVTNDAQTKAAIVPNTAPTAGQVLVGNAGNTAYAPVTVGGDAVINIAGQLTVTKTNNVAFGTAAVKNVGATASDVAAGNAATTVNGQTCTLGSTCTVADSTKVPTSTTVAGKALSGNITLAQSDLTAGNYAIGTYYVDMAEIAAPANPAASSCRLSIDSTAHTARFVNSAGASCWPTFNQNTTGTAGGLLAGVTLGDGTKYATATITAPVSNKCVEVDTAGKLVIAGSGAACGTGGSGMTNPMTTLGDIIAGDTGGSAVRVAGNSTTTEKLLTQTGTGTVSAAPGWNVAAPLTSTATANNYLTGYDRTTGAWTKKQIGYSEISGTPGLATVATTGAYSDLSGKPTLPVTKAVVSNQFLGSYDSTTGAFTQGSVSYTGLTNLPSFSVAGAGATKFATTYNTSTGFTFAQPAFTDISGTATTAQIPALDVAKITTGTFATSFIPTLDAAKIGTGILANARIITTGSSTASRCLQTNSAGTGIEIAAAACGTGSGSTPGGSATQLQYNTGSALGGIAGSGWDATTLTLPQIAAPQFTGTGTDPSINLPSNPAHTSAAGDLWRNAANLRFHDGTGERSVLNDASVINVSQLTGTIATARLGSGSATSSTFLAGDQTWKSVSATPAGTGTELQYKSGSSFGAVTSSSVSGANVTLGGTLAATSVSTSTAAAGKVALTAGSGGGSAAIQAPATTTANAALVWTLPVADSSGTQYLVSNGSGALSWATPGGTGDVTDVNITTNAPLTGGTTCASGACAFTFGMLNQGTTTTVMHGNAAGQPSFAAVTGADFAVQNANKVLAGPTTGADAAPGFRALVAADIPVASTTIGGVKQASACSAGNHISSIVAGELTCSADAGGTITGTDKQVMFFDGTNTPAGNAGLTFDKTTAVLSVVKASTAGTLTLSGATSGSIAITPVAVAGTGTALTLPAVTGTAVVAATSTTATQALFATTTAGAPNYRAMAEADMPAVQTIVGSGAISTLTERRGYVICTTTCTVTVPAPVAGNQYCVRNAPGAATVITLAARASTYYELTDHSAWATVNQKLVSGAAATSSICLVGYDSTHYATMSYGGTWTDTP